MFSVCFPTKSRHGGFLPSTRLALLGLPAQWGPSPCLVSVSMATLPVLFQCCFLILSP